MLMQPLKRGGASRFMLSTHSPHSCNDMPDSARFFEVVGDVIRAAAKTRSKGTLGFQGVLFLP